MREPGITTTMVQGLSLHVRDTIMQVADVAVAAWPT